MLVGRTAGLPPARREASSAAKLDVISAAADLDPQSIREAQANAIRAGVADRVTSLVQDIFDTDIQPATVGTLFLSPEMSERPRPRLTGQLKPGSRIVSHHFGTGDPVPEQTAALSVRRTRSDHSLWRMS
ncbi:MAG TPA: hypothetical protein VID28_15095 [Methylomirabilota bacterium]